LEEGRRKQKVGEKGGRRTNFDPCQLSGGAIAGIIIGCLVGVAVLAALVFVVLNKKDSAYEKA
jgi:hypothetical protein